MQISRIRTHPLFPALVVTGSWVLLLPRAGLALVLLLSFFSPENLTGGFSDVDWVLTPGVLSFRPEAHSDKTHIAQHLVGYPHTVIKSYTEGYPVMNLISWFLGPWLVRPFEMWACPNLAVTVYHGNGVQS
jgi:hypothetical protein